MKEKVYCPALHQDVRISRKGWDHLVSGTSSRRRNIKDKHLRLTLLKSANYVIKNAEFPAISNRNGVKYIGLKARVNNNGMNAFIKVLLKQDKQGKFYFYSVMKAKKGRLSQV